MTLKSTMAPFTFSSTRARLLMYIATDILSLGYFCFFAQVKKEVKKRPEALLVIYFYFESDKDFERISKEILLDSNVMVMVDNPAVIFWPADLRNRVHYNCTGFDWRC